MGSRSFIPISCVIIFRSRPDYSQYLGGYDRETYLAELGQVILGGLPPENVILLELTPHEQKTRIDFYCTRDYLGIEPVCLTELVQEGRRLYYHHAATGRLTEIKRIYNRIIFDELHNYRPNGGGSFVDIRQDLDVEWIPHPNWFYRVSKYTLPFIRHPFVPQSFFVHEISQPPADLENYVLKPLFSFAGQGVVIDVSPSGSRQDQGSGELDSPAESSLCRSDPDARYTGQGGDTHDVSLERRGTATPPRNQSRAAEQGKDDRGTLQQG